MHRSGDAEAERTEGGGTWWWWWCDSSSLPRRGSTRLSTCCFPWSEQSRAERGRVTDRQTDKTDKPFLHGDTYTVYSFSFSFQALPPLLINSRVTGEEEEEEERKTRFLALVRYPWRRNVMWVWMPCWCKFMADFRSRGKTKKKGNW